MVSVEVRLSDQGERRRRVARLSAFRYEIQATYDLLFPYLSLFSNSINSYQIANAKAISAIAALAGQTSVAKDYAQRAATLKTTMQNALWNSTFSHFIDRYQVNNQYVKYYDFIIGRELVGYLPWTFNITDDRTDYNAAWSHLLNTAQLAGKAGPRTNEPSSPYYMHQYRYDGSSPG